MVAEDAGDDEDERQHGEGEQGQPPVDLEHEGGHENEVEEVIDYGQHAGGEHFVDGVYVGGDAGDEASDGVSVKEADVHALHVAENVAPQIEHQLLTRPLHEVDLDKLEKICAKDCGQIDGGQPGDALVRIGGKAAGEPVGCAEGVSEKIGGG